MIKKILLTVLVACFVYYLTGDDPFNEEIVRGLRVVVTGASTGIGEQLAYQYARMGAHLVITARREQQLKQVIENCRSLTPSDTKLLYFVADMGKPEDTQKLIQFAVKSLGGIDNLMMNHAYYADFHYWLEREDDMEELKKAMDVNFYSLVNLWSHAMPHMTKGEGKGALGVVSSMSGKLPTPFDASYSASKFALDGFFGAIRQELKEAKLNITVTLHVLGLIGTSHASQQVQDLIDKFDLDPRKLNFIFPPADPTDCAYQMIRATTLGERELYYPGSQMIGAQVKLRHIAPWLFELLTIDNLR